MSGFGPGVGADALILSPLLARSPVAFPFPVTLPSTAQSLALEKPMAEHRTANVP